MSSRSKVNDFERSENEKDRGGQYPHIFECTCNNIDDNVAMSFIHALFSENIDNDL